MMDVFNKLFFEDLAAMSIHERIELCERTVEKFSQMGLVFAGDALVVPPTLNMYQETLAAGRLKIRIYTMNYAPMAEPLTGSEIKTGFGCGKLRIGPIKLFARRRYVEPHRCSGNALPYATPMIKDSRYRVAKG